MHRKLMAATGSVASSVPRRTQYRCDLYSRRYSRLVAACRNPAMLCHLCCGALTLAEKPCSTAYPTCWGGLRSLHEAWRMEIAVISLPL